jgi:hypothetical protein
MYHSKIVQNSTGAISRRSIIGAAVAFSSVATLGLVCRGNFDGFADDGSYRLSQLLSSDNKPTGLIGEFLGQLVRVRGVPSPSGQKGVLFSLTDFSAGLCASCGFLHGSGRSLPIVGAHGTSKPIYFKSYDVEGVLEFGENKQLQINVS